MSAQKHRIPAFTVIEVMVALVLTALVISFIFGGIRFLQRQSDTLVRRLEISGEVDRFYRALQTDANRASEIRCGIDEMEFSGKDSTIYYQLNDSVSIRKADLLADTFRIRIDSLACWFAGGKQEPDHDQVDEICIYLSQNNRPVPIWIRKHYDMATRMRLTDSLPRL